MNEWLYGRSIGVPILSPLFDERLAHSAPTAQHVGQVPIYWYLTYV
jgi:hypothetical protein